MMDSLFEGLREHELDHLILPLVSIDEYKSKIDDRKAIVVGFYVTESDPAYDLATFIEKGNIPVLDTDVSPAPTTDGYYMVFIEFDRNDKFPDRLMEMIKDISNITNVDDWEFSPYKSDEEDNYELTDENIRDHINLDPDSIEIDDDDDEETPPPSDKNESVARFLGNGLFESMEIRGNDLLINGNTSSHRFRIIGYSEDQPDVPIVIGSIDDPIMSESRRLQGTFGPSYYIYPSNDLLLVANDDGYLLLKSIDV